MASGIIRCGPYVEYVTDMTGRGRCHLRSIYLYRYSPLPPPRCWAHVCIFLRLLQHGLRCREGRCWKEREKKRKRGNLGHRGCPQNRGFDGWQLSYHSVSLGKAIIIHSTLYVCIQHADGWRWACRQEADRDRRRCPGSVRSSLRRRFPLVSALPPAHGGGASPSRAAAGGRRLSVLAASLWREASPRRHHHDRARFLANTVPAAAAAAALRWAPPSRSIPRPERLTPRSGLHATPRRPGPPCLDIRGGADRPKRSKGWSWRSWRSCRRECRRWIVVALPSCPSRWRGDSHSAWRDASCCRSGSPVTSRETGGRAWSTALPLGDCGFRTEKHAEAAAAAAEPNARWNVMPCRSMPRECSDGQVGEEHAPSTSSARPDSDRRPRAVSTGTT